MQKSRGQRRCQYIAFVDFVKAFDTIDPNLFCIILGTLSCFPKLKTIIKKLCADVHARLVVDGKLTQCIEYNSRVKQGCKLAQTLFGMYAAVWRWLALKKIKHTCSVQIKFCFDVDQSDLQWLTAKNKVLTILIGEAHQCADDIAIFNNARGMAVVFHLLERPRKEDGPAHQHS